METAIKLREAGHEQIKQTLRRWIVLLKISAPIDETEKALIIDFLVRNYGWMEPGEILTALELALRAEFKANLDHFGALSAKFITGILNPYLEWKRAQPKKVDHTMLALASETESGRQQRCIDAVLSCFERYKANPQCILPSAHVKVLNDLGISLINTKPWNEYVIEAFEKECADTRENLAQAFNLQKKRDLIKYYESLTPDHCQSQARSALLRDYFARLVAEGKELKEVIG